MTRPYKLRITLDDTSYSDSAVRAVLEEELGQKYELELFGLLLEEVTAVEQVLINFAFWLAKEIGIGVLRQLGKDLYTAGKRFFSTKGGEKAQAATFEAKTSGPELKFVFLLDAMDTPEQFAALFSRSLMSSLEMVEQDPRLQRCQYVAFRWNEQSSRPEPWQALPRDWPKDLSYYEWDGRCWQVKTKWGGPSSDGKTT